MKFAEIRGFRDLIMELYGYPPKVTPRHGPGDLRVCSF